MSVTRVCLNCMYFDGGGLTLGVPQSVPGGATGLCKHDPPTVLPGSQTQWPGVAPGDWCGQHAFQQQGPGSTFQTQQDITRQGGGRI